MSDSVRFTLRIEGLMPEDLPMRRLAAYLDQFARLLGEEASTRLDGVYSGSARLTACVLSVAVPKVRERLAAARDDAGSGTHYSLSRRLDDMMAEDNASGSLSEEGQHAVIIQFPGARARMARLPAVTEPGSIQGELVRIGGRDDTAHASLRDGDRYFICIVTKDMARALGKHLFGKPLRLHGRGRWRRTDSGAWELTAEGFKATDFEVLDPATLQDAATKLQAAGGFGLHDEAEAWDELSAIRGTD
jgi:hypothetical protein